MARSGRATSLGVALLLLFAAPAALSWGNDPIAEPSSTLDEARFMWPFANDAARRVLDGGALKDRLYFNAQLSFYETAPFPNLPGGRLPPLLVSAEALIGYWRDCNNDGYLGNAATGQIRYAAASSVSPIDVDVCPAGSAFNPGIPLSPSPGYNQVKPMIYEFIWVGNERGHMTGLNNPFSLNDPESKVWGDFGRPDAPWVRTPATIPFPTGFFDSWGAHFEYVDALTYGRLGEGYGAATGKDIRDAVPAGTPTPLTPIRGLYSQQSPSQPDGRPLVTVWECDAAAPQDPPALDPGVDPGGSVFDSTNNTWKGLTVTIPSQSPVSPGTKVQVGQGCDGPGNNGVMGNGFGQPVVLERAYLSNGARKIAHDFVMIPLPPFTEPRNQLFPWVGIRQNVATGAWFSRDVEVYDATGLRDASYFTFYAKVGQAALSGKNSGSPAFFGPGPTALPGTTTLGGVPTPPAFAYGEEACTSPLTNHHDWDCDGWSTGGPYPAWEAARDPNWGVSLGTAYQLRDTDCVDLTVALASQSDEAKAVANEAWQSAVKVVIDPAPKGLETAFDATCA